MRLVLLPDLTVPGSVSQRPKVWIIFRKKVKMKMRCQSKSAKPEHQGGLMGSSLDFRTSTLFKAGVRRPPNVKDAVERCVHCIPFFLDPPSKGSETKILQSSIGLGSSNKLKVTKPRSSEPVPAHVTTPPGILRRVGPSKDNIRTPLSDVKRAMQSGSDLDAAVAYNQEVQEKLNQISAGRTRDGRDETEITIHSSISTFHHPKSLVKRVNDQISQTIPAPRATLPLSVLFLLLLTFISNFQKQSSSIGFCDTGLNTNEIALHRQTSRSEAEACLLDKAKLDMMDRDAATKIICDTTDLPLIPFLPVPTGCTACPAHAQCSQGEIVSCAPEYKLVTHPLSFLAPLANGFPGIGPRPFPPACVPDTAKKRLIGALAKAMEKNLAQHRGDIICQNLSLDQGEVEKYGVDEEVLRERFSGQKNAKLGRKIFDELFSAAIKDLVEHEDLVVFIDVE